MPRSSDPTRQAYDAAWEKAESLKELVASFGVEPLTGAVLPADGSALMQQLAAAISALSQDEDQEAASALEASAGQVRTLYTALIFALPLLASMASGEKVKPYQALLARFPPSRPAGRWRRPTEGDDDGHAAFSRLRSGTMTDPTAPAHSRPASRRPTALPYGAARQRRWS